MKSANISEEYLIQKRVELGEKLREIREQKGLNQDQLAEIINIDRSTISKIEAGKWNFGINTLNIFAVALEFKIELL